MRRIHKKITITGIIIISCLIYNSCGLSKSSNKKENNELNTTNNEIIKNQKNSTIDEVYLINTLYQKIVENENVIGCIVKLELNDFSDRDYSSKLLTRSDGENISLDSFFHKDYFITMISRIEQNKKYRIVDIKTIKVDINAQLWASPILINSKEYLWNEVVLINKYSTNLPTVKDIIEIIHPNIELLKFENLQYEIIEFQSEM